MTLFDSHLRVNCTKKIRKPHLRYADSEDRMKQKRFLNYLLLQTQFTRYVKRDKRIKAIYTYI